MQKTTRRCGLFQLYAVLAAACFMKASLASFLPAVAAGVAGGLLGGVFKTPQQQHDQHLDNEASSASPRRLDNEATSASPRRQPLASSVEQSPSSEERLFKTEGWEGEADVSDWEPFRLLGQSMVNYIANYYQQVEDRPVGPSVEPGYLKKIMKTKEFPSRGEKWTDIMADVESFVMPGMHHWQHPRFFAYFPANTSPPAILADMLTSMFNAIGFSWESCPAATELEMLVLDQLGRAVGLPDVFLSDGGGGGITQASASEATLVGLLAARTRALTYMRKMSPGAGDHELMAKMTLYTSDQAHSSVIKAANIAGLGENMRQIPTRRGGGATDDNANALDVADLAAAIKEDVAAGLTPIFVCANVGSTNSCAVDPVRAIGKICRSCSEVARPKDKQLGKEKVVEGLVPWLHIDAAYAGSSAVCPENRWILDGVEAADSYAFNLHKWLLVSYECTAMWVKKSAYLTDAMFVKQDILYSKDNEGDQMPDLKDMQVPLGHKFRSLKIWFTMRAFGMSKIRGHIRRHTKLAKDFTAMVKTDKRFEIVAPPRFGLVCFRLKGTDAANDELRSRIVDTGLFSFSSTNLGGQTCLRVCVGSPATTTKHVQEIWDSLVKTADGIGVDSF